MIVNYACLFKKKIFFLPHWVACGILVPQPGIEPGPLAERAWSPNHWTAREFPELWLFLSHYILETHTEYLQVK